MDSGQANKSVVMTVRFTSEEADLVRAVAQKRSMSSSDLIREAVKEYTQPRFLAQRGTVQSVYAPPQSVVTRPESVRVGGNLGTVLTSR